MKCVFGIHALKPGSTCHDHVKDERIPTWPNLNNYSNQIDFSLDTGVTSLGVE